MHPARSPVGRWPWVTLALVSASLATAVIPGAGELLQYKRSAVESGACWLLLSSQLVHWTPRMATADLLVLFVTGAWLESRSRRLVSWTIVATGLLVGITLYACMPALSLYRGISGIASGLFVATALDISRSQTRGWIRHLALASLLLFGAKIAWEMATGGALFAGQLPPAVSVVPSVHVVGALTGILCFALASRRHARSANFLGGLPLFSSERRPRARGIEDESGMYVLATTRVKRRSTRRRV